MLVLLASVLGAVAPAASAGALPSQGVLDGGCARPDGDRVTGGSPVASQNACDQPNSYTHAHEIELDQHETRLNTLMAQSQLAHGAQRPVLQQQISHEQTRLAQLRDARRMHIARMQDAEQMHRARLRSLDDAQRARLGHVPPGLIAPVSRRTAAPSLPPLGMPNSPTPRAPGGASAIPHGG